MCVYTHTYIYIYIYSLHAHRDVRIPPGPVEKVRVEGKVGPADEEEAASAQRHASAQDKGCPSKGVFLNNR